MVKIDMERPERCETCPLLLPNWRRKKSCALDGGPDACPLLYDGPKVLTWEEAMASEVIWIEGRADGSVIMVMPTEVPGQEEMYMTGVGGTWRADALMPRDMYGIALRAWDRRPTEEQRRMTKWA